MTAMRRTKARGRRATAKTGGAGAAKAKAARTKAARAKAARTKAATKRAARLLTRRAAKRRAARRPAGRARGSRAAKPARKKSAAAARKQPAGTVKTRAGVTMKPAGAGKKPAGTKKKAAAAARQPARGPSAARRPDAKAPRKPRLEVVRVEPAPGAAPAPPEPQAFAGAKAAASAKDLVLFELVRARVAVAAAIQGMSAASADQPTAPGKWTFREMVLHLAYWDRECLPLLEDAYQHGQGTGLTHEHILARNDAAIEELRHHDWDEARRLLQLHRERLMEEFQSIPEEPAEMWSKAHPVGRLARILTHHDRHHADKLKAARTHQGELFEGRSREE